MRHTFMKLTLVFGVALSSLALGAVSHGAAANVELIIDSSGSMAGRIDGTSKMAIAKEVVLGLIKDLPDDGKVAIRTYGHRRKDDCSDIALIAPLGDKNEKRIDAGVVALQPKGKTPIAASLEAAATDFRGKEGERNVVILVSDGKETCDGDPCAAARALRESGVQVEINVIGFDVSPGEREQLQCIAQAGGGKYFDARSAGEFKLAASEVKERVAQAKPSAPPKPEKTNLLAPSNGGELVAASQDNWAKVIDGEEAVVNLRPGDEAIFAFKDEQPATFDAFAVFIPKADAFNVKEFELLAGSDSPSGTFVSLGKFQAQNIKLLKNPYQEFKFQPTTAKYLKVKLLTPWAGAHASYIYLYEIRLFGKMQDQ